MSRGSSGTFLNVVNQETPNDIFLHLVTIFWPDGAISHYVKNFENITSRGVEYQASSFNIQLPDEPDDSSPEMRFTFGVIERDIVDRLNSALSPPQLRLELVLASNPDVVELGPFDFDIREYQSQGVGVSVTAGFEPILDLAIPQLSYNTILFPGLFKDVRGRGGDLDLPTGTELPAVFLTESLYTGSFRESPSSTVSVQSGRIINTVASNLSITISCDYQITPDASILFRLVDDFGFLYTSSTFTNAIGSFNHTLTTNAPRNEFNLRLRATINQTTNPGSVFTNYGISNRNITVNSRF